MSEQQKQRGGWFKRRARENNPAVTTQQAGTSGRVTQWLNALQERMDNATRTRDLANRLNQDLAGILATCSQQIATLDQRAMRTPVQLSVSLGRLAGFVRQLETTRSVCAMLLEATAPQVPAIPAGALAEANGANGGNATATYAAPATPSRPLVPGGNASGPLAAPVVRDLGRGGFKRMARDLQGVYRQTAVATQGILQPIQTGGIRVPEVNALASALAAIEPLMTWVNRECERLTATYCAPSGQQPGNPPGLRDGFWQ
jgi:hypothetical protein